MISIEEIKLLIEKLEKVKKEDLQELIETNLRILKDIEASVDANNKETINRLDKTPNWYQRDLEQKRLFPVVNELLYKMIRAKVFQFAKSNLYNSLEIGPGDGMFSKLFTAWRLNYFVDVLPKTEKKIRKKFIFNQS